MMHTKYFVFILAIFLVISGNIQAGENPPKADITQLENRVKQILKQDNVSMRKDVGEVFALADIYAKDGRNAEAIDLYTKALQVDSWRLEYQLKLARLINLKSEDLNTFDGKLKFVEAVYIKSGYKQDKIDKFIKSLKEAKDHGQFDVSKLLDRLEEIYKPTGKLEIKGYLGIMSEDIYSGEKDNNFLFGLARKGYGVMSYSRFTAKFNDELPNRPRLYKRIVKQALSSSFFILGISRCTTPTCVRAYAVVDGVTYSHGPQPIDIIPTYEKEKKILF